MPGDRVAAADRKSDFKDHISPYKIALLVVLREHAKFIESMQDEDACDLVLTIHHLVQVPDLDLKSLFMKLEQVVSPQNLDSIRKSLSQLCSGTVHLLHELMDEAPTALLSTPYRNICNNSACHTSTNEVFIHKASVLGIFIRRLVLSFDKMTFYELCRLYTLLCNVHRRAFPPEPCQMDEYNRGVFKMGLQNSLSAWHLENGDISDDDLSMMEGEKISIYEDDDTTESKKYSQKQAEYFIAHQAYLLNHNEFEALPPKELHIKIMELIKCNPVFAEAHYLKYMNYLRIKEYNASIDSLFNYFDRVLFHTTGDQRSKVEVDDSSNPHSYRYAALNVAATAYRFGHRAEAIAAILECIKISQQNNDSVCLQHALGWLNRLEVPEEGNTIQMLEKLVASSNEYNLPDLASMGCQSYARQAYLINAKPALVFENMMASDIINSDHSLIDLFREGFSQKSALWNLYGRDELSKTNSLLTLSMRSQEAQIYHNGESECLALCHVAKILCNRGEYEASIEMMESIKKRFPQMSNYSHIWIFCEQQIRFQMTLLQGLFGLSDRAIKDMTVVNDLEGSYSRCVYLAETGEMSRSLELLNLLIEKCNVKIRGTVHNNHILIRCLMLKCNICCTFVDPTLAIQPIVTASILAKECHYSYLAAMVTAHVAFLQLKMEMYESALKLITNAVSVVLDGSSFLDHGRVLFLYVRIWLAMSNYNGGEGGNGSKGQRHPSSTGSEANYNAMTNGVSLSNTISGDSGIGDHSSHVGDGRDAKKKLLMRKMMPVMNEVCNKFQKVEAHHRLNDALFFMALMYDEVGLTRERNRTSLQFNQNKSQINNNPTNAKYCSALI